MNTDLRERAILPVLIALAAIIVFCMSPARLAAGKYSAIVIALGAALAILIGAAFIAARPRISTQTIIGVLTILVIGSIAAGAYGIQQKPFYEREAAANRP